MAAQVGSVDYVARNQSVGKRLRELREQRGIPKERLALVFEMSGENWRHYESGRNRIAIEMLPELADFFDMAPEALLTYLLAEEGAQECVA